MSLDFQLTPQPEQPASLLTAAAWKLSPGGRSTSCVSHLSGVTLLQCPEFFSGMRISFYLGQNQEKKNPVSFIIFFKVMKNSAGVPRSGDGINESTESEPPWYR